MKSMITSAIISLFGATQAYSLTVVSDSVCSKRGVKIGKCQAETATLNLVTAHPDYVPVFSKITRKISGNCATTYPMSLLVKANGETIEELEFLSREEVNIRWPREAGVSQLSFSISAPLSHLSSFHRSCNISLEIGSESYVDYDQVRLEAPKRLPEIKEELSFLDDSIESFDLNITLFDALLNSLVVLESVQTDLILTDAIANSAMMISNSMTQVIGIAATDPKLMPQLSNLLAINTLATRIANATCDETGSICTVDTHDAEIKAIKEVKDSATEFVNSVEDKKSIALNKKQKLLEEKALIDSAL